MNTSILGASARGELRRRTHCASGLPASAIRKAFCFLLLYFATTTGHYWLLSVIHSCHLTDGNFGIFWKYKQSCKQCLYEISLITAHAISVIA